MTVYLVWYANSEKEVYRLDNIFETKEKAEDRTVKLKSIYGYKVITIREWTVK